jgi:hypothetical protein
MLRSRHRSPGVGEKLLELSVRIKHPNQIVELLDPKLGA